MIKKEVPRKITNILEISDSENISCENLWDLAKLACHLEVSNAVKRCFKKKEVRERNGLHSTQDLWKRATE